MNKTIAIARKYRDILLTTVIKTRRFDLTSLILKFENRKSQINIHN